MNKYKESLDELVGAISGSRNVTSSPKPFKPLAMCARDLQELIERATPVKATFIVQGSDSFKYECKCGFIGWHKNRDTEVTYCEKCGQARDWE